MFSFLCVLHKSPLLAENTRKRGYLFVFSKQSLLW